MVFFLSIIFNASWHYLLTHQPLVFYICTGQKLEHENKNVPMMNIPVILSGIINFSIYLRILFYKKIEKEQFPQTKTSNKQSSEIEKKVFRQPWLYHF